MEAEQSDGTTTEIPVPDGLGEGINVRISGSNIEFTRYEYLLRRAAEAGAKAMEAAERGVDEESEALIAWAARHGVDVDDSKDVQLFLRMGNVEHVERRINEAY